MYKLTLKVDGMACSMCEAHVNNAVRKALSVKKVSSSHKKGITEIECENMPDVDLIKKAIEETGYKVLDNSIEEIAKKGFSLFGKRK